MRRDSFNESEKVRVKRFNDTYHNEAIVAKAGIVDKSWADRLMFGFTYSHMYKGHTDRCTPEDSLRGKSTALAIH